MALVPSVPQNPSVVLRLLCNWVFVSFCTCPQTLCVSPHVPLSPTPVLLMACQPCRGAGRIWCCRSHKVRPWGWVGWGFCLYPQPWEGSRGFLWLMHALSMCET